MHLRFDCRFVFHLFIFTLYLLRNKTAIEIVKVLILIGHIWCIENEEKILAAEQENLKTLGAMKKTITSEDILSTLPSSRYFDLFSKNCNDSTQSF